MSTLSGPLAEIFPSKYRKLTFNQFELDTERELAWAFRRYPRKRPYPDEVPHYPYLPHPRCSSPVRITFNLGFNPFAIN